jgi:hypothetical protein
MSERQSFAPLRFGPDAPYTVMMLRELVEAVDEARLDVLYLWSEHINSEGVVDGVQVSDLYGNRVAVREAGVMFSIYKKSVLIADFQVDSNMPFDQVVDLTKDLISSHLESQLL